MLASMILSPHKTLNQRHRQVIDGIARGLSVQEMAHEFNLVPRTVKMYSDEARWLLGVSVARKLPQAMKEHDAQS